MERLPAVLNVAELARIRLRDGMDFRPIRRALGVSAFGINAYTANAGELVIEPHDELGAGSGHHEELYVVLSGEAEFELDGERTPAPVGTLVFVAPERRRAARALRDDTTVLVIGGKPGAAGPPSPFEYWYLAQAESDPARRYAIIAEGLEHHADNASLQYNLACYAALAGEPERALEHLRRAFALEPQAREWAADDPDLDAIRDRI